MISKLLNKLLLIKKHYPFTSIIAHINTKKIFDFLHIDQLKLILQINLQLVDQTLIHTGNQIVIYIDQSVDRLTTNMF